MSDETPRPPVWTETHRQKLKRWLGTLPPPTRTRGQLEEAVRAALAEIARLQAQTKLYGRELDDWAEKEASVCAEDVSFVDRIKWLEAELQQTNEVAEHAAVTIGKWYNARHDAALAEIARLQEELNAQVLKAHAANSNYRQVAEQLEALQNDVREERT